MEKLVNASDKPIKFKISTLPGLPPTEYDVAPGESCEVAAGYVASGLIFRLAPGLVKEADMPAKAVKTPDVETSATATQATPAVADVAAEPSSPAPIAKSKPKGRRRKAK